VSNAYTGQYGRQAGAQIDYITKSGTNSFHGDALYYWTGRALSANDFFNNANGAPPLLRTTTSGGGLGGPLKRDKAFSLRTQKGSVTSSDKHSGFRTQPGPSKLCTEYKSSGQ